MALQKTPRQVVRKKRVLNPDGTYESGKKIGRPRTVKTEKFTIHLEPALVKDLKNLATLHYRGNMSAFLRVVLSNALPALLAVSEQANKLADEKRPHIDPGPKKRKPRKVRPDEDLGFEVV